MKNSFVIEITQSVIKNTARRHYHQNFTNLNYGDFVLIEKSIIPKGCNPIGMLRSAVRGELFEVVLPGIDRDSVVTIKTMPHMLRPATVNDFYNSRKII